MAASSSIPQVPMSFSIDGIVATVIESTMSSHSIDAILSKDNNNDAETSALSCPEVVLPERRGSPPPRLWKSPVKSMHHRLTLSNNNNNSSTGSPPKWFPQSHTLSLPASRRASSTTMVSAMGPDRLHPAMSLFHSMSPALHSTSLLPTTGFPPTNGSTKCFMPLLPFLHPLLHNLWHNFMVNSDSCSSTTGNAAAATAVHLDTPSKLLNHARLSHQQQQQTRDIKKESSWQSVDNESQDWLLMYKPLSQHAIPASSRRQLDSSLSSLHPESEFVSPDKMSLYSSVTGQQKKFKGRGPGRSRKRYICCYCQREFSKSYNLMIHVRTHTNERPFECELCHKSFRRQDHLRDHKFTHLTKKPYECSVCGKGFCQLRTLTVHRNTHMLHCAE